MNNMNIINKKNLMDLDLSIEIDQEVVDNSGDYDDSSDDMDNNIITNAVSKLDELQREITGLMNKSEIVIKHLNKYLKKRENSDSDHSRKSSKSERTAKSDDEILRNESVDICDKGLQSDGSSYGYFSPRHYKKYREHYRDVPYIDLLDGCSDTIDERFFGSIAFNSFDYDSKASLCKIAYLLFLRLFDFDELAIDVLSLQHFIKEVSLHYHKNPYHNFKHAVSVLQFTYLLISETNIAHFVSKYKIFGLMIAALVHDIDHPGHTNSFEEKNNTPLARKYNNKSILEKHHWTVANYIMQKPYILLLNKLTGAQYEEVRETIVECIMSTDMVHHQTLVNEVACAFKDNMIFEINLDENKYLQLLICKLIIHSSDLSNPVRPFEISKNVAFKVIEELQNQVKKEEQLHIPSAEYMKITNNKSMYKSEMMFAEYVVKPLWVVFVKIYPNLKFIQDELQKNMNAWTELLNSENNNDCICSI